MKKVSHLGELLSSSMFQTCASTLPDCRLQRPEHHVFHPHADTIVNDGWITIMLILLLNANTLNAVDAAGEKPNKVKGNQTWWTHEG